MAGISEKRRKQVKEMVAEGMTIEEIIEDLDISAASARRYMRAAKEPPKTGKILLLDIETSPNEGLFWQMYSEINNIEQITKPWAILTWSAKWLYEPKIFSGVVSPKDATDRKDGSIIQGLWNLLDDADVTVAHNNKKFDNRRMNARFVLNGLPKPSPYFVVDTLTESRKQFDHVSHKLDYLATIYLTQRKTHTDFSLWKRCIGAGYDENEQSIALSEMLAYNKSDVTGLEEIYLHTRPYMTNHPNMALYGDFDGTVCKHCLSENVVEDGYYVTPANKYIALRCKDCGSLGRSAESKTTTKQRKNLMRNIAR